LACTRCHLWKHISYTDHEKLDYVWFRWC
jgi:hypothetical protein